MGATVVEQIPLEVGSTDLAATRIYEYRHQLAGGQVIYAPFMRAIFDTAPLSGRELALAAVVGASILPVIGVEKAIRRRQGSARIRSRPA
jgi:hypothetical protein